MAPKQDSSKKMSKIIQTEKLANKIIDTNYNKNKHKTPFTQVAENANKLLGYKFNRTTGKTMNSEGNVLPMKEAVKINDALEKNFRDHKERDYLANLEKYAWEHDQNKRPKPPAVKALEQREKISDQPIFKGNINHNSKFNKKSRTGNPSGRDYWREFVANGGKKLPEVSPEDLNRPSATETWNNIYRSMTPFEKGAWNAEQRKQKLENEKEEKELEKDLRAREYKNKKAGKPPHANFSTSDQIVLEASKDRAKEELAAINTSSKITTEPNYFDYREAIEEAPSFPTLDQWMKARAPIEQDPPGITGLDKVKSFKRSAYLTDQKFPKVAKGIGPFLTGEDD